MVQARSFVVVDRCSSSLIHYTIPSAWNTFNTPTQTRNGGGGCNGGSHHRGGGSRGRAAAAAGARGQGASVGRSILQAFRAEGKIGRRIASVGTHSRARPHQDRPPCYLSTYQVKGGGGEVPAPVLKHVPDAVLKRKLKYKVRQVFWGLFMCMCVCENMHTRKSGLV